MIAESDSAVATSADMTPFSMNLPPSVVGKSARLIATIKSNDTSKPWYREASSRLGTGYPTAMTGLQTIANQHCPRQVCSPCAGVTFGSMERIIQLSSTIPVARPVLLIPTVSMPTWSRHAVASHTKNSATLFGQPWCHSQGLVTQSTHFRHCDLGEYGEHRIALDCDTCSRSIQLDGHGDPLEFSIAPFSNSVWVGDC